jgi:GNAT superfamily N-acetyltransferase
MRGVPEPTTILPLSHRPEAAAALARGFKEEWPAFFAQRSIAEIDEQFFSIALRTDGLPAVLVAVAGDEVCGTVALRSRTVETHLHLDPWLAGLWVAPAWRGRGLGRELVHAAAAEASARGYRDLYAVTATARGLFDRLGWRALEELLYHGEEVTLYRWVDGGGAALPAEASR